MTRSYSSLVAAGQAFITALIGAKDFGRWEDIRSRQGFADEGQFIKWLLDIAEQAGSLWAKEAVDCVGQECSQRAATTVTDITSKFAAQEVFDVELDKHISNHTQQTVPSCQNLVNSSPPLLKVAPSAETSVPAITTSSSETFPPPPTLSKIPTHENTSTGCTSVANVKQETNDEQSGNDVLLADCSYLSMPDSDMGLSVQTSFPTVHDSINNEATASTSSSPQNALNTPRSRKRKSDQPMHIVHDEAGHSKENELSSYYDAAVTGNGNEWADESGEVEFQAMPVTDAAAAEAMPNEVLTADNAGMEMFKDGKVIYGCTLCNAVFNRRWNLTRHLRSGHGAQRDIVCDGCGKNFARQDHKSSHQRGVTSKKTDDLFLCNDCGQIYSELNSFGSNNTPSESCKSDEKDENGLEDEEEEADDPDPLEFCDNSGERTNQDASLGTYGSDGLVRKFSCHLCRKMFTKKKNMERHVKTIHENVREAGCPFCDKTYTRKETCIRHIQKAHPDREPPPDAAFPSYLEPCPDQSIPTTTGLPVTSNYLGVL